MGMTHRDMMFRMDSRELSEWFAYDCIDRIGEQRADERNAILCQMVAAFGGKPPKLEAFMPYPLDEGKSVKAKTGKQSTDDLAVQLVAMFGGSN